MFHNNATRILRTLASHHAAVKRPSLFNSATTKALSPLSCSFHTTPMAHSNAKLIQQLRKTTGAPMVECKKAISDPDVNGDFDKATEWLRKHGSAKMSSKLAGRDASEGLVGISISTPASTKKNIASIVRVNSETDFASRSPDFSDLVETVAGATLKIGNDSDIEELKSLPDVRKALDDAIVAIRENLQITSASTITGSKPNSVLAGYVHGKIFADKLAGTAAAIVELAPTNSSDENTKTNEEIEEIGKKLAMHIVAAKPEYMTPDDIPEDIIQKEKEILMEQMTDSGKPQEILEKIVTGRLGKFYQGICLVEQSHMLEDGNPKVSKALKGHGLELVTYKSISIQ